MPSIFSIVFTLSFFLNEHPSPGRRPPRTDTDHYRIAPFVFNELHGLLKQWPNSYAPNGHAVVIGTVAPFTPLFHGTHNPGLPGSSEFFAFDAEMSLGIYGGYSGPVIHTFLSTRSLRVIYFNGQSATLTDTGTLDLQMAILYGRVPEYPKYNYIYDEDQRARDLCAFAQDLGIDGVVRMNAGFEILLCHWSKSGVKHIFTKNITLPGNQARQANTSLPRDPNREPSLGFGNAFSQQSSFEWLRSATWHYGEYGQGGPAFPHMRLDTCTMISLYDPGFTSLNDLHKSRLISDQAFCNGWGFRQGHRLVKISRADVKILRERFKQNAKSVRRCSGANWDAIAQSIVSQHKTRLLEISKALSDEQLSSYDTVNRVHELSHAIVYPYLEYPFVTRRTSDEVRDDTISQCSSVYTSEMKETALSESERLLYKSINIVLERLCSDEWDLLEWSEKYTTGLLDKYEKLDVYQIAEELDSKRQLVNRLTTWMGWDNWEQCEARCSVDELCAIPTWPVIYAPGFPQGGIYAAINNKTSDQELAEFWRPKCINRFDFDKGGGRGREPAHQLPDVPSSFLE